MRKGLTLVSCVVSVALLVLSGCAMTGQAKAPKFVLRVNCAGSEPYTDKAGNLWLADQNMESGKKWGAIDGLTVDRGDLGIAGTDSPRVYETERYSMEGYKFSVPNGRY
ncbi:MAG: malectin domain-containing carbohydrate-binding protein, partial [Planctomycetota bacterium]